MSSDALPFYLLAAEDTGNTVTTRRYRPRPDFYLSKGNLPYFFVEFDSHDNGQDYSRMLVQMACSLRLKCTASREDTVKKNKYFLMGAFFTKEWYIKRVFCYVDVENYHEPVRLDRKSVV